MKDSVISAHNISIGYRKSTYGHDAELYSSLSFDLYKGELTCLLGQNGAGKSTLLRTLSSVQPPLSGKVFLEDKDISEYSEAELSHKIGLVLTDKTSIGGFKVSQIVALGRYPYTGFWGKLTSRDKEIVQKAMDDVCISHKSESYMAELSDGERQKVMIAKALAQECPIVFLDEPTAFLDIASRIEIMDLLHYLAMEQNKSILLSTHDVELALLLADRLWLLSPNNGLKCGITEDILLSGTMDHFLSRNDIVFNLESGSFYPKKEFKRFVYLDAETDNFRWIKNFLQRNSWDVTSDISKSEFALKVLSYSEIQVVCGGSIIYFSSFEDFYKWLSSESVFC